MKLGFRKDREKQRRRPRKNQSAFPRERYIYSRDISNDRSREPPRENCSFAENINMGGGRNEIALAVIGTALSMTSSSSSSMVEAAQQGSVQSSSNQTPRRAAFVRTPITNHQRAQYLRRAQQQSTEQKRLQLERNAKQKLAATEKVERMQAEAKGKLGLSSKKKAAVAEKDDEEEMVPMKKSAAKKEETDGMTTTTKSTTSSSSSSRTPFHDWNCRKRDESVT